MIQGPALLEASDSPEIVWKNVCGLVGWGYVQVNSGEEVLGFTKFSVGSLSQEKSKAATLSEVQDSVQNLNPSKHSLEHCSLTYRHRSGLPCSLTPPILIPLWGRDIQEEGAVL